MTDQETIAVYDAQIDSYVELVKRESAHPSLVDFIAQIEPGGYVLDLGCGPAIASAAMRDHGLRVDPVDASAEMVRLANANYDINARQAVFNELNVVDVYDGVWANFSLLHASAAEFPVILSAIHDALVSGGYFHIGMKTGNGSARDSLGRLYTYYSATELSEHLKAAGFAIEKTKTGEQRGLAGEVEPWIVVGSRAARMS